MGFHDLRVLFSWIFLTERSVYICYDYVFVEGGAREIMLRGASASRVPTVGSVKSLADSTYCIGQKMVIFIMKVLTVHINLGADRRLSKFIGDYSPKSPIVSSLCRSGRFQRLKKVSQPGHSSFQICNSLDVYSLVY